MILTCRKYGNLLELSLGGTEALPRELCCLIEPQLEYQHKRFLYGLERYGYDGVERSVQLTQKKMYRYDQFGRLVTNFGFFWRLRHYLREKGHELDCFDYDPPRVRPDCYTYDLNRVQRHFDFRARQEECLRSVLDNNMGVVWAATGFGKMVQLVMKCLATPHAKTDIVTRRTVIANKIWSFLTRYIADIGRVGDGKKDERRITVYNADSLHHSSFDADDVLCDEGHELLADDYATQLGRYTHARLFAYTASPHGRSDGADMRLEALFGRMIFYMPYWEAVELGLVVPIRVELTDVVLPHNPVANKSGTYKERWGIWRNERRNRLVAAKAASFAADEQVLVLVKTIEHAVYLRQFLPGWTLVYAPGELEAKYVRQGLVGDDEPKMTPARRDQLREDFESGRLKKAIATGVWSVGIDPVQLVALVRAQGGSTEIADIQAPGRVSRTHTAGGKEVGIVCDFVDKFDAGLMRASQTRIRHYKAMRWDVVNTPTRSEVTLP
jgi:superfamily II DNA or RNA helicase